MPRFAYDFSKSRVVLAAVGFCLASVGFALGADGGVGTSSIPDFSSFNDAWIAINSDFTPDPGSGPKPVTYDAKYPFRRNDEPRARRCQLTPHMDWRRGLLEFPIHQGGNMDCREESGQQVEVINFGEIAKGCSVRDYDAH